MSGWTLSAIAALDIDNPGLAGHFARSTPERRQVIAAYLSTLPFVHRRSAALPNDRCERKRMAEFLATEDHHTIIAAAFGSVPVGMRGALRRTGSSAQPPRYYRLLYHILNSGRRRLIADVVRELSEIDLQRLTIACTLPHEILHPAMIERISDLEAARDIAIAIKLLRERVINVKGFEDALRRLRRNGDLGDFLQRWMLRSRYPASPVPQIGRYRPILDGVELKRQALAYRNCSASYAIEMLEGRSALGEFHSSDGKAMIRLVRLDEVWFLDDVYAPRNGDVDEAVRAQAVDFLRLRGIHKAGRPRGKSSPFSSIRRLRPRGPW